MPVRKFYRKPGAAKKRTATVARRPAGRKTAKLEQPSLLEDVDVGRAVTGKAPAARVRYTNATPQEVLKTMFGYDQFRPGQQEVIEAVLAGRDCIALMPTGAGKSLTFQIPAAILDGPVLVISPLISLMKDQVDGLIRNGFRATMLNSSIDFEERRSRLAKLRRGELELVYVAPEALVGGLRDILASSGIALIVVDEAHCISHWGHDFRPAYRTLRGLKSQFGEVPILALTATATKNVAGDIISELGMHKPFEYKGSFFRPNLHITTQKKGAGRNTRADILALVRAHQGESAIIYCQSRRSVDDLAAWLKLQGVKALPYHAGLDTAVRIRNQDAFARGDADIIVGTLAYGMGLDYGSVRLIIHKDLPKSTEGFFQEIGRAGRDGLVSECVLMYSWADVITHDYFLESIEDPKLRKETRERTIALFRMVDSTTCRHQALVACFEERIEPCGTSCDVCKKVTLGDRLGAVKAVKGASKRSTGKGAAAAYPNTVPLQREEQVVANPVLFEQLRALRRKLADAENVPAYIIFNDAVLRAMAEKLPKTKSQMLSISGIGPTKLERYGKAFLDVIKNAA